MGGSGSDLSRLSLFSAPEPPAAPPGAPRQEGRPGTARALGGPSRGGNTGDLGEPSVSQTAGGMGESTHFSPEAYGDGVLCRSLCWAAWARMKTPRIGVFALRWLPGPVPDNYGRTARATLQEYICNVHVQRDHFLVSLTLCVRTVALIKCPV